MGRFDSFVMFAGMRTGSNFLEANLNALPGVACHGEAFNPHFIGKLNQSALFGVTLAEREADPMRLLQAMRRETAGMSGFRYFHDHDPRVFGPVVADARCAKIVLSRNPLDSYVSLKIAQATGQWKLTNAKRLRTSRVRFDAAEFARFVEDWQAFHLRILNGLQVSGQAAFHLGYDDIPDVAVLNGLAEFLGVAGRLEAPDPTLKKQNPEPVAEKVENPDEMLAALARMDWFDLSRPPVMEPRRSAAIPTFMAAGPLLFMPVQGGPQDRVLDWLKAVGPVTGGFVQKSLRQWMRGQPRHRGFAVVRHPLLRAHAVFRDRILTGAAPEIRGAIGRILGVELPHPDRVAAMGLDDHRAAFLGFLRFARMNLAGQTGLRVDARLATQTAILQGFAQFQPPDVVLREDRLAAGLGFLCAEAGIPCPPLPPEPASGGPALHDLRTPDIDAAARDAYARDYLGFGFGDPA